MASLPGGFTLAGYPGMSLTAIGWLWTLPLYGLYLLYVLHVLVQWRRYRSLLSTG